MYLKPEKPGHLKYFSLFPIFLIMFFSLAGVLYSGNLKKKLDSTPSVSGVVLGYTNDSEKTYVGTLLDSYDPDPHWKIYKSAYVTSQPEINASSGILADINTGQIYFEKNSGEQKKIASLVKVMTAVLTLEHGRLSDKAKVSARAANAGENSMGISEGEVYTVEQLLYGLILNSGNDAAYALAEHMGRTVENFTDWMNLKAKELGLKNTYFADPSGLDDSTYSTTEDLLRLARYAMKNPEFRRLVKTLDYEIPYSETNKYIYLENQTNLLRSYPGVAGIKTGFTEEAGLSLITYAENGDHELIGVVLHSEDRKGDMVMMLDHGFGAFGLKFEHHLLDPL